MHKRERTSPPFHTIHKGVDVVKKQGNFIDRVILRADLPGERAPGVPLVEIVGDGRVLIENHFGVTSYGCNEICVKVRFGHLRIFGTCLELARMSNQQLVITGKLEGISILRGRA